MAWVGYGGMMNDTNIFYRREYIARFLKIRLDKSDNIIYSMTMKTVESQIERKWRETIYVPDQESAMIQRVKAKAEAEDRSFSWMILSLVKKALGE